MDFRCLNMVFVQNNEKSENRANILDCNLLLQSLVVYTTLQ